MAYCRKGPDSDLYVIGNGDGYECLCCPLADDIEWTIGGESGTMKDSWYGKTISHLGSHLLDHVGAGHKVPQDALDRVECEERGVEYVDPEVALWRLLDRLSASGEGERLVRSYRAAVTKLEDATEVLQRDGCGIPAEHMVAIMECIEEDHDLPHGSLPFPDNWEDDGPDCSDWPDSGSNGT